MKYLAHVHKLEDGRWDEPQSLEAHLKGTAELAAEFAADFDSAEWAYAAGLAHDAGKGRAEWQAYFYDKSEYDEEASSETVPGKCEHSGYGAKLAEEVYGKQIGRILAYCIAGHHPGLPDYSGSAGALEDRLQRLKTDDIAEEIKALLPSACPKAPPWRFSDSGLDMPLWIRMLFSSLVDADRLDTERYMDPKNHKQRGQYASVEELKRRFDSFMEKKTGIPTEPYNHEVYQARQQILADCMSAAKKAPGFFSLTVPTGGGKTLAGVGFALTHAKKYNKKRILVVTPLTSIIEQNAAVFREVFGDDEVVEHHSNLDENDDTTRSRLATENWDAPIIITTAVQFFESLFAAKTSRARRVHNIANSVVIMDEAQLTPPEHLKPILEVLRLLVEHYKTTFVFCTATQPVFEKQSHFRAFPGLPQGSIREIINDVPGLYAHLKRAEVLPPAEGPVMWKDLARELAPHDQALCIVSDRKSCRELHNLMPKGTWHLSALMCAQHRSDVIEEIKKRLKRGEPVRVISTQLVEAGVDFDFPSVYRATAGFDSVAQAAGRCNREGKDSLGRVIVFNSPRKPPAGILRKAADAAKNLFAQHYDPLSPESYEPYFSLFYWKLDTFDQKHIWELLEPDRATLGIRFRTAGEQFRIIDDKNQRTILVRYKDGEKLIDLLKTLKVPNISILRKLQRYTVNIYTGQFETLRTRGSLEEIIPGVFTLNNKVEYNEKVGLLVDEMPYDPEMFTCI
jgi:CRISPR-associated endonuclease/helicase Cas3